MILWFKNNLYSRIYTLKINLARFIYINFVKLFMADMEISGNGFNECVKHELCVVDFFAEWCMPCVMMAPVFEALAERMKKVHFAKVNVDENQALAGKFKVMSIPTIIIFKSGKEVARLIGSQQEDVLEKKISEYLK